MSSTSPPDSPLSPGPDGASDPVASDSVASDQNTSSQPVTGQYVVVARRYRPQLFDQLIGQGHIAQALSNAISSDRVGHAYLFTGARGVGKTSAARIMAKALNCSQGPSATPCNECDICERVSSGDDIDVLEIDGASNRGIDEIRELRQNATVRPSRARYKIYIIDEVHMLTREAFNALLKTLEEPPEHVKFIFCTTEPEKIPVTILSRCQRFDFAGIRTEDIAQRLTEIVQSEGVAAESEAVGLLARRAAGSMRDSQSLLEQLLSFGHDTISVADVHRLLGTADDRLMHEIVTHVAAHDAAGAIETLDRAMADGVDVGQLLGQLLGYLRDVLIVSTGCSEKLLLYVAADQIEAMRGLAEQFGTANVTAMMQMVDTTLGRLRYSTYARTLAELTLVRLARLEDLTDLSQAIAQLASGQISEATASRATTAQGSTPRATSPASASKKNTGTASDTVTAGNTGTAPPQQAESPGRGQPASSGAPADTTGTDTTRTDTPPADTLPTATASATAPPPVVSGETPSSDAVRDAAATQHADPPPATEPPQPAGETTAAETFAAEEVWATALERLTSLVGDQARFASRATIDGDGNLVIFFPARYNLAKTYCERSDPIAQLTEVVSTAAGRRLRVRIAVDDTPEAAESDDRESTAARSSRREDALQNPLVIKAAELFGARPIRVDEPE